MFLPYDKDNAFDIVRKIYDLSTTNSVYVIKTTEGNEIRIAKIGYPYASDSLSGDAICQSLINHFSQYPITYIGTDREELRTAL